MWVFDYIAYNFFYGSETKFWPIRPFIEIGLFLVLNLLNWVPKLGWSATVWNLMFLCYDLLVIFVVHIHDNQRISSSLRKENSVPCSNFQTKEFESCIRFSNARICLLTEHYSCSFTPSMVMIMTNNQGPNASTKFMAFFSSLLL